MKAIISEEKLNKFLNEYYHQLSLVVAIVVLAFGTFFFLWPQYQELHESGILEHKEAISMLENRQAYLKEVEDMKEEYENLNLRAWKSLDYVLPRENEIYLLFAQMEKLIESRGYILTSININDLEKTEAPNSGASEQSTSSNDIKKIKVTLNITEVESYQNFKNLLDLLENNIRILDISSIAYSSKNESYSFIVDTYYLKSSASDNSEISEQAAIEEEILSGL